VIDVPPSGNSSPAIRLRDADTFRRHRDACRRRPRAKRYCICRQIKIAALLPSRATRRSPETANCQRHTQFESFCASSFETTTFSVGTFWQVSQGVMKLSPTPLEFRFVRRIFKRQNRRIIICLRHPPKKSGEQFQH